MTARLAWHNDGWNGAVCKVPERNTYCVGWKSYPGDVIARERDLSVEKCYAGCAGKDLKEYIPPCSYSYNAFGPERAQAASEPPDFFFGGAARREWTLPAASVCIWPYEAMYNEEVEATGYLDNDRRRELTLEFFEPVERDCGSNLVFYYANYSNPLSEEEVPRYVMIGVSRITEVGEEIFYDNVEPRIAEKYAGGLIWARRITSSYPQEGVRLPYHRYLDDPERLAEIAIFPEHPALCKYGSKHVSDDEAIGILEQFLSKVRMLKTIGDETENWAVRENWLHNAIAELWTHRGLYPGLLKALDVAGAARLIEAAKKLCIDEGHGTAREAAFEVLDGNRDNALTVGIGRSERKRMTRNWRLLDDGERMLLRDVLPRLELSAKVMKAIASARRGQSGLSVSAQEIAENPYLLSELYCGDDPTDWIP